MKKIIAMLLVLMLVLSLGACASVGKSDTPSSEETAQMKSFTVTVVHKDGTSKDFTYKSSEEFVGTVLQAEGLVAGNMGPYGLEIHTVDPEKAVYAEDGAYWAIFVGEEYAMQGIDTTPIVDGGVYKLVYTLA